MTLSQRQVFELCEQFAALHEADPQDTDLQDTDLQDGKLDAAALQELEQRIREDREVRRLYLRYMRVCAGLAWDMGGAERPDESTGELPSNCPACQIGAPLVPQENVPLPPVACEMPVVNNNMGDGQGVRGSSETGVQEELPATSGVRSPVLGFLGGVAQQGWGLLSDHTVLFSVLAAMILVGVSVTVAVRNLRRPDTAEKSATADLKSEISDPEVAAKSQPPVPLSDLPALSHIPPPQSKNFAPRQVAVLTGVYNARWSGPVQKLGLGTPLMIGQEFRLDGGLAEITFKLGARVIVAAPAHLRLTSIDGVQVLDGNVTVRADTETARGFIVNSAVARVVDLGTEFGAAIEQDRQTDLHVFQGMVEVSRNSDKGTRAFRLAAGQRIVMRQSGDVEVPSVGADGSRFTRSLVSAENDFARWQRWNQSIRKDADLVGYYLGESQSENDRILRNVATGSTAAGTVRGASWAEGRWPGKPALRFSDRDDCVRMDIPGRFRCLTLTAWVNLEALRNEFNALLLTNGWTARAGQFHWQLTRSGRMDFGINFGPGDSDCTVYHSLPVLDSDDFGRWLHLAVVYDTAARQIEFYADGRLVNSKRTADDIELVAGPCELGNWYADSKDPFPVRNFQGRIDELMIFRRALTAGEVKTMYEEGKP